MNSESHHRHSDHFTVKTARPHEPEVTLIYVTVFTHLNLIGIIKSSPYLLGRGHNYGGMNTRIFNRIIMQILVKWVQQNNTPCLLI